MRAILPTIVTLAILCAACSDSSSDPTSPNENGDMQREAVASVVGGVTYPLVALTPTLRSLKPNDSTLLQTKLTNEGGGSWTGQFITWKSSDTTILRVRTTGTGSKAGSVAHVKALRAGTATLSATTLSKTVGTTAIAVSTTTLAAAPMTTGGVSAVWSDKFVSSVGVATHFSYWDLTPYGANVAQTVAAVKSAGFRFIRDGLIVLPDAGWNNRYWGVLRSVTQQGIKLVLTTRPGSGVGAPYTNQSNLDSAVNRVGVSNILAFEGPNEVDLNNSLWGGLSAYGANARAYQNAMYRHAKQIAPSVPVLGLTTISARGSVPVGDISGAMDFANMHPYPGGLMPLAHVASMESALSVLNGSGKGWWVTETGYHSAPFATQQLYQPGVSEVAEGKYVPRLYLDYFKAGISHTAAYELIDERSSTSNAEMNYGLLHNNGTPKPAYNALKNLLGLLSDPGSSFTPASLAYSVSNAPATVRQMLLQKRDGRFYLVLWNDVSVYDVGAKHDISNAAANVTVTFGTQPRSINRYQPYLGSAPTYVTSAKSITVAVPDHPVVLEITR
jgi:hypothetical protein